MKIKIWHGVIYVLIVGLSQVAVLASEEGTLKGTIVDPSGAVVSGVQVRVQRWKLDPSSHKPSIDFDKILLTDDQGNYTLQLSPGVYDIFFSSPAFTPVAAKVQIKADSVQDASPTLKYDPLTHFTD